MKLDAGKIETSRAKRWAFQGIVLITILVDLIVVSIALWCQSSLSNFFTQLASANPAVDGANLEKIEKFVSAMLKLLTVVPTLNLSVILYLYTKQRKPNICASSIRT